MEFVNIILQNSNLKEAKLYGAAQKAATNPEIGITIQNRAAYHVIKDCATITMSYLPHLVFGSYVKPFESLKGKFKKEHVVEFVKQAEENLSLNQLLHIIVSKAEKMNIVPIPIQKAQNFDIGDQSIDPYGSYGMEQPIAVQSVPVSITSVDVLCRAFGI
jgi:hypothetical protein